jgi:hypothetical protein
MNNSYNPFHQFKEIILHIRNIIKQTHQENNLLFYLIRFLILFILISFVLYLILQNEKPGSFGIHNYFWIFFIAILPSMLNGFSMGYFHLYLESSANEYVENMINTKTLHQLGLIKGEDMTKSEFDQLQNMIHLKTIIISTISLALSTYLSNFLRLIIDKGVIQDIFHLQKKKKLMTAEEYIRRKDNPFVSFMGVIIGGILFTIFYFINYQKYTKNQHFWTLNPLVLQTYKKQSQQNIS